MAPSAVTRAGIRGRELGGGAFEFDVETYLFSWPRRGRDSMRLRLTLASLNGSKNEHGLPGRSGSSTTSAARLCSVAGTFGDVAEAGKNCVMFGTSPAMGNYRMSSPCLAAFWRGPMVAAVGSSTARWAEAAVLAGGTRFTLG